MAYTSALQTNKTLLDAGALLKKLPIHNGMKVADLGCGGAGHFVLPASSLVGDTGTVYAVDILKSVLTGIDSMARMRNIHNIHTLWSNLEHFEATALPNGFLDSAFLVNILFLSTKHKEILQETARMIKKGGSLLVIDWKDNNDIMGPPQPIRVSPQRIINYTRGLDLELREQLSAGKYHYALIFEKQ